MEIKYNQNAHMYFLTIEMEMWRVFYGRVSKV